MTHIQQTSITEHLVFVKHKDLPNISEVLSDAPCLSCPQSLETKCDVTGCQKLTAWLIGDN